MTIINDLALRRALDDGQDMNDAIFWLTYQAIQGLRLLEAGIERTHDIAGQFHDTHRPFRA